MKTLIEENEAFIANLPSVLTGDKARIALRLIKTNQALKALIDQANAQFKAGDRHATFNKQTIEATNRPLSGRFVGE